MLKTAADAIGSLVMGVIGFTFVFLLSWACITILGTVIVLGIHSIGPDPLLLRVNEQMGMIGLLVTSLLALVAWFQE
jgi:hypothetical protein